jgi:membrane protein DedA with SNARE-associated domain
MKRSRFTVEQVTAKWAEALFRTNGNRDFAIFFNRFLPH